MTDFRGPWRAAHPLPEGLPLTVCGTIAAGDDDIVDWGAAHLPFPRRFPPYHFGIPRADWLRTLMNRMDPGLFPAWFTSWAGEPRPDASAHIALDGKTSQARLRRQDFAGKTSRSSPKAWRTCSIRIGRPCDTIFIESGAKEITAKTKLPRL